MIKENTTHYFFDGILHLNAQDASMRLTRREVDAKAGTRQCKISVAVPKTLFEEPQLSINVEIKDAGTPNANASISADVDRALTDLPVVVNIIEPQS